MPRWLPLPILILMAMQPSSAIAHPHVFVDTALIVEMNDERDVTSVEVIWAYDDFFSLLVLQDKGMDEDADGVLTDDELADLQGWDMQWVEGYEGDLYLKDGEASVELSGPIPVSTEVRDGRIVSIHRRDLIDPVPTGDLTLRAYDPEFYTAYDLTLGVRFRLPEGAPECTSNVEMPDQDTAYQEAQDLMAEFPEDAVDVPLLGHLFAETVTITC